MSWWVSQIVHWTPETSEDEDQLSSLQTEIILLPFPSLGSLVDPILQVGSLSESFSDL